MSNTALVSLLDSDKTKAIRSILGDRTIFDSNENATAYEQAAAHIEKSAAATESFHGLPVAIGSGLEESDRIVVATVGVRDKEAGKNGYKAIVVFAAPAISAFLSDESEAAKAFVAKVIEREATDVAFAGIRTSETVEELQQVLSGLPVTVADIVETSRASAAGSTSFDKLWADFRKLVLKVKYATLEAVLPQKPEILKAIRSSAYAKANPATRAIEENGLFVKMAAAMIQMGAAVKDESGAPAPVDTSDMAGWIADRDTHVIEYSVPNVKAEDLAAIEF